MDGKKRELRFITEDARIIDSFQRIAQWGDEFRGCKNITQLCEKILEVYEKISKEDDVMEMQDYGQDYGKVNGVIKFRALLTTLFITFNEHEDVQKLNETIEKLESTFAGEYDRTLYEILRNFSINPFVLRLLSPEQQQNLEEHLNDCESEKLVIEIIGGELYDDFLNNIYSDLDLDLDLDNESIITHYCNIAKIFGAYPIDSNGEIWCGDRLEFDVDLVRRLKEKQKELDDLGLKKFEYN